MVKLPMVNDNYITVQIGKTFVKALIDTGSAFSIMSERTTTKAKLHHKFVPLLLFRMIHSHFQLYRHIGMDSILIICTNHVYYSLIIHVHYFLICTLWYDDFHELLLFHLILYCSSLIFRLWRTTVLIQDHRSRLKH